MIKNMVIRDIRARYVGSFIGIFWTFIHPVSQVLIYYFVFSVVLKIRLSAEYGDTSFAAWLIAGLLPWFFFSEVVTRSPNAILEQADVIKKTVFPTELLSVTHFISAMISHLIGLVIFECVLLALGHKVSTKILLILPSIIMIGLFSIGISWALSALNVFLRDIGQVIGVFMQIWFFMTPIFYPLDSIPQSLQGIYLLNPMLHIIETYRDAMLGNSHVSIENVLFVAIYTAGSFVAGGLIFKKLKPTFTDVL